MQLSLDAALSWTERLTALSIVLQTLELLAIRRAFADDGVWRWAILRQEHARLGPPLRGLLALLLPYRRFLVLLGLRLPLAGLLAAGLGEAAWPLCLSQLAIGARFRGTFNGGSDYMTMVLLLGLSVAALPGAGPSAERAGLGYVCVQLLLSYFIAGLVKLRQPAWRSGAALRAFLDSPRYGAPAWISRVATPPRAALSWLVMALELGFPFALLRPGAALVVAGVGLVFHAANAAAFGLNRFLFAWAAAYPAFLYFSAALSGQ